MYIPETRLEAMDWRFRRGYKRPQKRGWFSPKFGGSTTMGAMDFKLKLPKIKIKNPMSALSKIAPLTAAIPGVGPMIAKVATPATQALAQAEAQKKADKEAKKVMAAITAEQQAAAQAAMSAPLASVPSIPQPVVDNVRKYGLIAGGAALGGLVLILALRK